MSEYIERYWRGATPEDAIAEPPMVARFRYKDAEDWEYDLLVGWDRTDQCHWRSKLDSFEQCQVYDAPDPGEGWRLIDPEKDDYNQDGIEYWCIGRKRWLPRFLHNDKAPFLQDGFYRCCIEPPKPKYVPFTWEDREQLRGRLITYVDRNRTVEFRCESFAVDDDGLIVNDAYADWLCKHAVFVDTKKPVGKRVQ